MYKKAFVGDRVRVAVSSYMLSDVEYREDLVSREMCDAGRKVREVFYDKIIEAC